MFTVEICFIWSRLSLVDNPRIRTDFESTTINKSFIRFIRFNFMYFFTNALAANFQMVLFIENMTNFSISRVFASGMWTIDKLTSFYEVSYVLVASALTRLIEFLVKNFISISGRLRSVNSAAWPALIALNSVRSHSRRNVSRKELSLVPRTIISLIRESWRLSNSHSEFNFYNSVTKSWTFWPFSCLFVNNLCGRMVVFFLGLQYSEYLRS